MGPNCPHITGEHWASREQAPCPAMLMLEAEFIETPEQIFLIITYISHMLSIYIANNSNHLLTTSFFFFFFF